MKRPQPISRFIDRVLSATIYTPTALLLIWGPLCGLLFDAEEKVRYGYGWLPSWGVPLLVAWGLFGIATSFQKQEKPQAYALFSLGSTFVYGAVAFGLYSAGSYTGFAIFTCFSLQCLKDLRDEPRWVQSRNHVKLIERKRADLLNDYTGFPGGS